MFRARSVCMRRHTLSDSSSTSLIEVVNKVLVGRGHHSYVLFNVGLKMRLNITFCSLLSARLFCLFSPRRVPPESKTLAFLKNVSSKTKLRLEEESSVSTRTLVYTETRCRIVPTEQACSAIFFFINAMSAAFYISLSVASMDEVTVRRRMPYSNTDLVGIRF